jgi:hypothetical protein
MMVIDNFINNFHSLNDYAKGAEFKDEVNDIDGVVYPLICREIPESIYSSVIDAIGKNFKKPVKPLMFMRRSPKGVHCPHKVHSDNSMGKYSLMLYMSDDVHGTSFLRHNVTGAKHVRYNDNIVGAIIEDQNNDDAWRVYQMNYGAVNRAVIFDAHLLHRAEPVGGFGDGDNARTVLTCFFS